MTSWDNKTHRCTRTAIAFLKPVFFFLYLLLQASNAMAAVDATISKNNLENKTMDWQVHLSSTTKEVLGSSNHIDIEQLQFLNQANYPVILCINNNCRIHFQQHPISLNSNSYPTNYITAPRGAVCAPEIPDDMSLADGKTIALTFDDGPDTHGVTENMVHYLKELQIPATFFINGNNQANLKENEKSQELIRLIYRSGFHLGNHTLHHWHLGHTQIPTPANEADNSNHLLSTIDAEILENDNIVQSVLGDNNFHMSLIRAPYGERGFFKNPNQRKAIICNFAQYGVHVGWAIDTSDYLCKHEDCVLQNFIKELEARNGQGGIVLMHSLKMSSFRALKKLVPLLQEKGYRFVDVEDFVQALYQTTSEKVTLPDNIADCMQQQKIAHRQHKPSQEALIEASNNKPPLEAMPSF